MRPGDIFRSGALITTTYANSDIILMLFKMNSSCAFVATKSRQIVILSHSEKNLSGESLEINMTSQETPKEYFLH